MYDCQVFLFARSPHISPCEWPCLVCPRALVLAQPASFRSLIYLDQRSNILAFAFITAAFFGRPSMGENRVFQSAHFAFGACCGKKPRSAVRHNILKMGGTLFVRQAKPGQSRGSLAQVASTNFLRALPRKPGPRLQTAPGEHSRRG